MSFGRDVMVMLSWDSAGLYGFMGFDGVLKGFVRKFQGLSLGYRTLQRRFGRNLKGLM